MRTFTILAVVALAGTGLRPVKAQGSVAGKWSTEFDIGIRNENGVETSMGTRAATMTLSVKGDSVFGTWQAAADSTGKLPAAIHLSGTTGGSKARLRSEPVERTVRMNDEEQKVKMFTTYVLAVDGDKIDGTSTVAALDGSFEANPRPFSAKRITP
jgi:hypothetical protein